MQIRHFRRFRQNGPFLVGDKNTVYQKHGLCHPDITLVKKITELIPKQFRFGNSFTEITENNSKENSVIQYSHLLPRLNNSSNKSVR